MSEAKISSALMKGLTEQKCHVWKANDARTAGIPDIVGCTPRGRYFCAETKLVKEWPARSESFCLHHPLSRAQMNHLVGAHSRGAKAFVAIGFPPTEELEVSGKYGCALVPWETWCLYQEEADRQTGNVRRACLESMLIRAAEVIVCAGSMSSAFVFQGGLLD